MAILETPETRNRVYEILRLEDRPMTTGEVVRSATARTQIRPTAVRSALWHLVNEGKIEFTSERKLQIKG